MKIDYAERWQSAPVYRASDFFVTEGINVGQNISGAEDLCLGDIFQFAGAARSYRLNAFETPENELKVSQSTMLGAPGSNLRFDCCLTLISETGIGVEMCLIVETDKHGQVTDLYYLPHSPVNLSMAFELIKIERITPPGPGLPAQDQQVADGFADVLASQTRSQAIVQHDPLPETIEHRPD